MKQINKIGNEYEKEYVNYIRRGDGEEEEEDKNQGDTWLKRSWNSFFLLIGLSLQLLMNQIGFFIVTFVLKIIFRKFAKLLILI